MNINFLIRFKRLSFYDLLTKVFSYRRFHDGLSYRLIQKKNTYIMEYLKNKHAEVIKKYENRNYIKAEDGKQNIWIFWWQGIDTAPDIIAHCIKSVKKNAGDHEVIIIDKYNYQSYVNIPDYIIRKLNEGIISIVHFSDLLRVSLLSEYGGLWLDATIYVSDTVPSAFFESDFYSVKLRQVKSEYVSWYRWSAFLLAGKAHNILFDFVREMLFEYWKHEEFQIDYFLIDYILAVGYETNPVIKEMVDKVPVNNEGIYLMMEYIDNPYNNYIYQEICRESVFHKLNRRHLFSQYDKAGDETLYNFIINA